MSNETTTSNDSASFSIRHVVEPLSLEKCVCMHTRGNHSSGERHCLNHFCECGLFRVAEIIASPASQKDMHPSILWLIQQVESKATGLDVEWEAVKALLSTYDTRPELWRAEVSSPARPQLAKIALADDIIEQVQRHYAGSGPLPTKGSTTVYADAQMVLAVLAEGAVSAAPQTHSLSCPANGQNLGGYRCECDEVSAAPLGEDA